MTKFECRYGNVAPGSCWKLTLGEQINGHERTLEAIKTKVEEKQQELIEHPEHQDMITPQIENLKDTVAKATPLLTDMENTYDLLQPCTDFCPIRGTV